MTAATEPISAPAFGSPIGAKVIGSDVSGGTKNFRTSDIAPVFDTLALAQAATINSAVQFLRLSGYTAPGDNGGATYKRVGSQPSNAGKFQSADGTWWQITGPVLSVKALGALGNDPGDGSTNDSTAIQNACSTAFSQEIGEVYFPPGTYSLLNVRLKGGITYRLDPNATIIAQAASPIGGSTLNTNTETNVRILGGVIDGNINVVPGSPSSGNILLAMVGSSDITVSGVVLQNNKYLAIVPSQASNIRVEKCEFYNTDCAFQPAQDCHDIWALNNLIDGGTSDGIAIWATSSSANSTNVHIRGNTIKNKATGNAIIVRRCDHFEVCENIIEDCALGVNINTGETTGGISNHGSIANNDFTGITSTFAIGGKAAFYVSILGNTISECNENGVYFESLSYSGVRGNIINNVNAVLNDSDGIRLQSSDYVDVDANSVIDSRGSTKNYIGIRILSGNRNTLANNKVRNTTFVDAYVTAGVTNTYCNDNDCRVDDHATPGQTVMVDNQRGADSNITVTTSTILLRDAPGDVFSIGAASGQTISTINGGWNGRTVKFVFSRNDTVVNNAGNIKLAGGTLTSAVDGTLALIFKGTSWYEISRSLTNA